MSNYLSRHNADADDETERWHAALEAWVADERAAEAEDEKRRQARERAAAEAEAEHDPDPRGRSTTS